MISGIYKITNKVNNKFYIGSSREVEKRIAHHFRRLRLDKHDNVKLQNAYNKYGENNFEFCILQECRLDDLLKFEKHYMNTLNPEFNLSKIDDTLVHRYSEESKKRMSEKAKLRRWTTEERNKLSISRKNSKKAIESNRKNAEKQRIKIEVVDLDGNTIKYESLRDASRKMNIRESSISRAIKSGKLFRKTFIFKRSEINN